MNTTIGDPNVEAKYPILGRLLWFSVSEPRIEYDRLEQLCTDLGLSTSYLPPRTRGVDAFRLACKGGQLKRVRDGQILENYMLREVVCDNDRVVQHIMQEKVDARGERLSYTMVGKAIYYRPDASNPRGRVVFTNEAPYFEQRVIDLVESISVAVDSDWNDRVTFLHSNAIRGVINRVLEDCATLRVRSSGGVFFSPEQYKDRVIQLTSLLNAIGGCQMHAVPLVDTTDERKMLTAAFEVEAVKEIERAMDEMGALLKSGKKITTHVASQYVSQHGKLTSQSKEYAELLDDQLSRSVTGLDLFKKQVNALVTKAE